MQCAHAFEDKLSSSWSRKFWDVAQHSGGAWAPVVQQVLQDLPQSVSEAVFSEHPAVRDTDTTLAHRLPNIPPSMHAVACHRQAHAYSEQGADLCLALRFEGQDWDAALGWIISAVPLVQGLKQLRIELHSLTCKHTTLALLRALIARVAALPSGIRLAVSQYEMKVRRPQCHLSACDLVPEASACLTSLDVRAVVLTDDELLPLCECTQLQDLDISVWRMHRLPEVLKALTALTSLTFFALDDQDEAEAAAGIACITGLQALSLQSFGDSMLPPLCTLKSLKQLNLGISHLRASTDIASAQLIHLLQNHWQLEDIEVGDLLRTRTTWRTRAAFLQQISLQSRLASLSLRYAQSDDADMLSRHVSALTALRSLDVTVKSVSTASCESFLCNLASLHSLQSVALSGLASAEVVALGESIAALTALQHLTLSECTCASCTTGLKGLAVGVQNIRSLQSQAMMLAQSSS